VKLTADGYAITQQRRGDTADVMLDYVGYRLDDLRSARPRPNASTRPWSAD
jgi:arginine decarboxylase